MTLTPPWLERLIAERSELTARLAKLAIFLATPSPVPGALDALDLALLRLQQSTMEQYAIILDMRITKAQNQVRV